MEVDGTTQDDVSLSPGLFNSITSTSNGPQASAPPPPPPRAERVGLNARANMSRLVGRTPLVFLNHLAQRCNGTVVCKMEDRNPCSSADRVSLALVENLENRGLIVPGKSVLVQASFSTGALGLAFVGAVKGYKVICVIPESVAIEQRVMAKAYGAELVVTPTSKGLKGALYKAEKVVEETPNAVLCDYWNEATIVQIHQEATGPEIWEDTHGMVDVLVAPVETGGALQGIGSFLKANNQSCKVVAVEPTECAVLSGGKVGTHKLQDLSLGSVPPLLDVNVVDEIFKVSSEQGIQTARAMARKEGILSGPATGATVFAALEIAKRPDMHDKLIVALASAASAASFSAMYEDLRRQCQAITVCRESEFRNMPKEAKEGKEAKAGK
jgi:cysteine synthase A|uniref:Tryptophan synthase beta chain-like PALP domain-containing protein n=1 Tax=Eutreptiella gymnastica TaxID=73025 RepID=A0A7S4GIJ3_9EUGL